MQKEYKWLPEYDSVIRRIWQIKCANILKNLMFHTRQQYLNKQVRPPWIPTSVMNDLVQVWSSSKFQEVSEVAKTNRASNAGGATHGGVVFLIPHIKGSW